MVSFGGRWCYHAALMRNLPSPKQHFCRSDMLTYNPSLTPSLALQIPAPKDRIHLTLLAFIPRIKARTELRVSNGVVPGVCPFLCCLSIILTPFLARMYTVYVAVQVRYLYLPLLINTATCHLSLHLPACHPSRRNPGPRTHRHRRAPIPPENIPDRCCTWNMPSLHHVNAEPAHPETSTFDAHVHTPTWPGGTRRTKNEKRPVHQSFSLCP